MRAVEWNSDSHIPHRRQDVAIEVTAEEVRRIAEVKLDADDLSDRCAKACAEVDDVGYFPAGACGQPRGVLRLKAANQSVGFGFDAASIKR